MKRRPLPAAAAAVAALSLLLTACGGSDDDTKSEDKINGADSAKPSPSPSESAAERPEIELPDDAKNVFEDWETGDPKKDAVLADSAESVNAVDDAIFRGVKESDALSFYNSGTALADSVDYIERWVDDKDTWVGTARYRDQKVSFNDDGSAVVIYCIDQSNAFIKDGRTGKVDKSSSSNDAYALTSTRLVENDKGVWQTVEVEAKRGAAECLP
ncbi:hypothetical protein [Streptomyces sp. 184]|uniref:hypothetical protein n=1 Tax=Streptomyces sp. 184 TaxID=1827526 RepID=UPI003891F523